ncbi:hypothetical protein LMG29542_04519 [Paraburkholderia humisilvae]|uniref:Uncharacterized protein n=1 Tax=Paraburkholderia humisilvae TaxID=627669 RepID=A0A6J5ED80_9BURK|nr:hypothetical protein LMG29542_04519 [Paraburkholderia humisilvae]
MVFAYFLEKLDKWVKQWHERSCVEHVSRASDLAEVKRRTRAIERHGYDICSSRER